MYSTEAHYARSYCADEPVVCFDAKCFQLRDHVRMPRPMRPGHSHCEDHEYRRCSIHNRFILLYARSDTFAFRRIALAGSKKRTGLLLRRGEPVRVSHMEQVITAKLKLNTTSTQYQALRRMQLAYRDGLNYVSAYSFANGKASNQSRLHAGCYEQLRARFGLPSQLACSVSRQVSASYQGLWTKARHNAEHRKAGYTKKRYRGLDKAVHYSSPTVTLVYGKDYGCKAEQTLSVQTLNRRIIVPYLGLNRHLGLIQHGSKLGEAKLWLDKPRKQFYLLVALKLKLDDLTPDTLPHVAGYDVGQRYLAVGTTLDHKTDFYPGRAVRHLADHHTRQRERLQLKGTRSAKRRLRALSGRETAQAEC